MSLNKAEGVYVNMYKCTVCLGRRAAGTVYFVTPCIIRLRRTKMLVLQTAFVWIRMNPASRREQWLFHRGKGPSEGPAQASKRLCVPGEKQKQRNSEV